MLRPHSACALAGILMSLMLSLAPGSAAVAEDAVAEFDPATGFRIARYRAPVPPAVEGAQTIFAADIERLVKEKGAVLVDVMAAEGGGPDPQTGAWRNIKSREHIPGSVWLPDVGRGTISAELDGYFRSNLERLTGGDRARPLVIYCVADCWMGWNAVKRAAGYGYSALYWFPDGTDGWRDWEGVLATATPVPLQPGGAAESPPNCPRVRP